VKLTTTTAALAAAALVSSVAPAAVAQDAETDRVHVVHITVDALDPSQVGPDTPVLQSLKDAGTWWEEARAVMASETLPNHVAIGTGTYPGTNGIPGNDGRAEPGDTEGADPDLGQPELLQADSFVTAIERVCPDLRTVTVFSKNYVHFVFEGEADSDFPQPAFNIPGSGHAPDISTVGFILEELSQERPDYLFANLGDVDRAGHIDPTGVTGTPAEQRAVLQQTDTLVGAVVSALQANGMWESTVLVISSDHSMDYSAAGDPAANVDVMAALEADGRTAGRFFLSDNGGAGFLYLLDPDAADADTVLRDAREVVVALDGVVEALYRQPNPLDPGNDLDTVHPAWRLSGTHRAGEIFLHVESGRRVGSLADNPIPGNHGHVITRHITALVTGGWDGLAEPSSIPASDPDLVDQADDTELLPEQLEQVDFAPTFGWLLGVPDPGVSAGGDPQWEGVIRDEAFARQPAPACVAAAGDGGGVGGTGDPVAGEDRSGGVGLPATGGGLAAGIVLAVLAGVAARRRRLP
jgi:hypothetical protein